MAVRLTGACMWSGVLTTTASISLSMSSNILRKSANFLTSGYFEKAEAARFSSTSHRATMFSPLTAPRFAPPWPPQPTTATLSFSLAPLGSAAPRPPAIQKPIPARPACCMNCLRLLRRAMSASPEVSDARRLCHERTHANKSQAGLAGRLGRFLQLGRLSAFDRLDGFLRRDLDVRVRVLGCLFEGRQG